MHKGNIVWFGLLSTEKQDVIHRINHLIFTPEIRFFYRYLCNILVRNKQSAMNMAKCNLIKLNQKNITPEARFASKSPFADFCPAPRSLCTMFYFH